MSIFDPPRPGHDHWNEERNAAYEDERRRERERDHTPAPQDRPPPTGPGSTLLMVVQVPDDMTIGEVVQAVGRQAVNHGVTLMLWTERPRRRHRRGMKLLFGRKLGKRLTG